MRDPLPGYELLEVLGEGGMATVFKARQRSTGRLCALKLLRDYDLGDERRERRTERFVREAVLLERLDHPNVVRLLASGHEPDGPTSAWIALEYVDGPSLENLLQREGGPLPALVVCALLAEVGRALEHLEARGVVHRDVKPANIIITAGGAVKLCDFGIACALEDELRDPPGGEVPVGTIDYMAPEQIEGEKIGPRVDAFALGCTAYRCLAGMTPFTGETVFARLREAVEREPPPLPRSVPPRLAALVRSLLAKRPALRPPPSAVVRGAEVLAGEISASARSAGEKLASLDTAAGEGWTRRALLDALARPVRSPDESSERPVVPEEPTLVVLSSEEITIERPLLVGEGFVIGRSLQDGGASSSIGKPWVSRRHCRIELTMKGLVVSDLGSANGTFVNSLKIEPSSSALVRPGDALMIGKTKLVVSLENAPVSIIAPLWKCLLCQVELPRDAGSTDEATRIEERHLCARCQARIEEDREAGEQRARLAIAALGLKATKRLELGGPIVRFSVEGAPESTGRRGATSLEELSGKKLAAHAIDLGPNAARYAEQSKPALGLDHPALLKVRNVSASGGVLVVVTDPIEGRTAADVVWRDGPLHPDEAVRVAATIAHAVAHAQKKGIAKVALTPAHVIMGKKGVQVLDVGLAPALVEAGRSRVELGQSLPSYEPPESVGLRESQPRALVYSIAAVSYFLLTGDAPVELRSFARRTASPLASRPEVPVEIARIIDRALSADPRARHGSPEELARELENLAPTTDGESREREASLTMKLSRSSVVATKKVGDAGGAQPPKPDVEEVNPKLLETEDEEPVSPFAKPAPAPTSPKPVRPTIEKANVDLAARLERLAREKATGVVSIHAARVRGRIELRAGKIVRVAAPSSVPEQALATLDVLLAAVASSSRAREAATTFEPGSKLEAGARVDLTVTEALARARRPRGGA